MIKKSKYILLLILFFELSNFGASAQGLRFRSNDNLIESRTSFNVFAEKTPLLKDFFEISFNLSVNSPESFGYVLFIKDEQNQHQYNLVYTNENDSSSYLKFSIDSKEIPISVLLLKKELGKRKWINISIKFDALSNSIDINIDKKQYRINADFTKNQFKPLIFFGKHGSFIDVPDISIKKLRITDKNSTFIFNLDEIDGTVVHDSKGVERGIVENPIWLINESFYWKSRFNYSSNQVTAINFDSKQQRFIFINSDSICFYDISKDVFTKTKLPKKTLVPLRLGLSFISEENNELVVYEINDADFNRPTLAAINLNTLQWEVWSYDQLEKQSHHHISYFNADKNEYLIFGGYGNKKYSNDFYSISKQDKIWKKIHFKGDTISPRFFLGSTKVNENELLVFGGAGNPSGEQSAGKIYYTDCYRVNLKTKTINMLWNSNAISAKMVSSRNLILTPDSSHFYTIYYPEYIPHTFLKLYKFSIKNGEYEILGDSIPMVSERIRTNANLYFNKALNELYCVTQEFKLDGSSNIKIYSISSPPVSKINFYKQHSTSKNLVFYFVMLFILGALILFLIWKKHNHKKKLEVQKSLLTLERQGTEVPVNQLKNAIYLFGNFKVFDNKGKEISYLFSPKILQLFLLILLNSNKNKITSKEIYSVLWPEKSIEKAKNSKGVVLNQLKKIVADIEGLELLNERRSRHYYFKTDSTFYCDYLDFSTQINLIKSTNAISGNILNNLIPIISRGKFLGFIEMEYFDMIKQYFENEVLHIVPIQLEKYMKEEDYLKVIQLCKIIYNIDIINELALQYELISYAKLNMLDKAKKRFNAFSLEYNKALNDDYNYTFRDLINRKFHEIIKQKSI